jgi:sn1-specific diacylglycerol lipase
VQAYQLVLVGHSMGAAVASLVGLLLRPVFPRLICVTYSMPATVMSYQLAEECSEWLRTVWVGKDVVARSSYRELIALRERIYDVLVRCKVNKTAVLRSLFTQSPADRLLYAPEDAPRTPEAQEMEATSARLLARAATSDFSKHPLYTPGRMLHLVKTATESTPHCTGLNCFKRADRNYVPAWVNDRTILVGVQMSSRMLFDHFPDNVAHTVEKVAEQYCYFSPASDKMLIKMSMSSPPSSPDGGAANKGTSLHTVNPQFACERDELDVMANRL